MNDQIGRKKHPQESNPSRQTDMKVANARFPDLKMSRQTILPIIKDYEFKLAGVPSRTFL